MVPASTAQLLLPLLLAACCLWHVTAADGQDAQAVRGPIVPRFMYVGCFQDHGHRDLSTHVKVPHLTPHKCYQRCDELGYRYFGLQAGGECYCGNTYGIYGEVSERLCNIRCAGNRDQFCGGAWRNGIYEIEQNNDCVDKIVDNREYSYVGCYGDGHPRDLPKLAFHGHAAVRRCYLACERMRYRYFGLQAGTHCFCGNRFGLYGRRSERDCSHRCDANHSQYCGGGFINAVYRITPPVCKRSGHQ